MLLLLVLIVDVLVGVYALSFRFDFVVVSGFNASGGFSC